MTHQNPSPPKVCLLDGIESAQLKGRRVDTTAEEQKGERHPSQPGRTSPDS